MIYTKNHIMNLKFIKVVSIGLLSLFFTLTHAEVVSVGSIRVSNAYTRATVPGQQVAGGFLNIENLGATDQLIGASSAVANEVQLHEMLMDGNVMRMFQIKEIPLPANGRVDLRPGGLHLMFLGLRAPIIAGQEIPVRLKFARSGEIEVRLLVSAPGSSPIQSSGPTQPPDKPNPIPAREAKLENQASRQKCARLGLTPGTDDYKLCLSSR